MLLVKLWFVLMQPMPPATKLHVKKLSRMRNGHSDNDQKIELLCWTSSGVCFVGQNEREIMKAWHIALCMLSTLSWPPAAQAQETVDVAKITCNQFTFGRVADSRTLSIWVAGYYNGTINNTLVDVAKTQERVADLVSYCIAHPDSMLMDAVKSVIGSTK